MVLAVAILLLAACVSTGEGEDQPAAPAVTRTLSSDAAQPGGRITVAIMPVGVDGFFAVQEAFGGMEVVSNTAASYRDGVFVQLDARPFEYTLQIADDAVAGSKVEITGSYWTDPETRLPVSPAVSIVTVE